MPLRSRKNAINNILCIMHSSLPVCLSPPRCHRATAVPYSTVTGRHTNRDTQAHRPSRAARPQREAGVTAEKRGGQHPPTLYSLEW